MGIKGDVRSISLANVLQDLAMNEQTGTLRIRGKERQIALWFERGALRLVGLGPGEGPSLVNGLIARQRIAPEEIPAASGRRTTEVGFIRRMQKKGSVSPEDLKAALEHQMAEHLCDAFLWTDATFEFDEGEPDDQSFDADQLDLEPRLAVDAVIVEAMRRTDDWAETRKAILSSREILVPDPHRPPAEADATTRRILSLLDGERTLDEVQDATRLGQFSVHHAAAILLRCGAARPLAASEAFERARARFAKKEWDAALKMARYGLDHERTNLGLLDLALKCAEAQENSEAAAGYARQLASAQIESGQHEAAIASYQKVLVHAPRDLTAHERLFSILLDLDLKLDALEAGESLAAAYKKAGFSDKALDVYRRLVEKVGDQSDLLESLAEIQRHLGDKKEAIGIYRKLLARALEAKSDPAALDICRTILKIDPHHEESQQLKEQLESGELQRARRRRRKVKAWTVLGIVALLLLGAGAYEIKARATLSEARYGLQNATLGQRYREALDLYDRVIEGYPLSLAARELRPERGHLEPLFAAEEKIRATAMERRGQVSEAVKILEEALPKVRAEDLRAGMAAELAELRKRQEVEEERWRSSLASMEPAKIAEVRDPLAVPALDECLSHEKLPVRLAAVAALGAVEGDAAVGTLIKKALADKDLAAEAAAHLARRTGQDFGADRLKWGEWWHRHDRRVGKPPLQAALVAPRQSFGARDPVAVEWRITNLGAVEVEFTMIEAPAQRLQISGPGGAAGITPNDATKRTWRLGPGEFAGGSFTLSDSIKVPGTYRVTWSAAFTWDRKPATVDASPLLLERRSN